MSAVARLIIALLLFLGGIRSLSGSLKMLSGGLFHRLLKHYAATSLQGFFLGFAATFFLQSSSAVSVIVIGFIGGGFLTLRQGLCIIIGANVGTTITSQFFSLEWQALLLPLAIAGILLYGMEKIFKKNLGGRILLGAGAVLAGIEMLACTLDPLTSTDVFRDITMFSRGAPWKGILTGAALAGTLQSSSVIIGMVVVLARENILHLPDALAIMLGADLGTCVTSLLASAGMAPPAKQLALGHVIFNFISILLVLPFWPYFIAVAQFTSGELGRQVANAHFLYNLLGAATLLPLVDLYVYFCKGK